MIFFDERRHGLSDRLFDRGAIELLSAGVPRPNDAIQGGADNCILRKLDDGVGNAELLRLSFKLVQYLVQISFFFEQFFGLS